MSAIAAQLTLARRSSDLIKLHAALEAKREFDAGYMDRANFSPIDHARGDAYLQGWVARRMEEIENAIKLDAQFERINSLIAAAYAAAE